MSTVPAPKDLLALFDGLSVAVLRVAHPGGEVAWLGEVAPVWLADVELSTWWTEALGPDDAAHLRALIQAVVDGHGVRTLEHRLRLPSGASLWMRTTLTRSSEEPGAALLAMQDVTAARFDARQWRELESWLVTLGETLPFDFWIQDREGRFLLQNPASVKRLGHVLGQGTADLPVSELHRTSLDAGVARALAGEAVREELVFEETMGTRTVARALSPLHDGEGVVGVLGVDIDITALKESEAKLRASLSELQTAQETLVRRKQLVALGEMAAVVAHEVRNPLGSISNVVALLQRGQVSRTEERELWKVIADETRRLDLLVANLLDFVRPVSLEVSPRPLEPLLEKALSQTLWAEDATRKVDARVTGSAPPLPIDAGQLELAFTNLFRNAVQAMSGRGTLEVQVGQETRGPRRFATVTIRDSGPGLPEGLHERLFEPFVTTRARGHGLGLAIVRKVVEQHQGEVSFESVSGRGTTCIVRLPMAATDDRQ
jgi:PAS domain S-box-containing protein